MNSTIARIFRIPSLILAAALQVMPIVRAALPVTETAANVLAVVFRWVAGAAAALGGVQVVSGASTTITNPLSTNIVEGQPFSMRLTTAPDQAHYWTATGLPTGLSVSGTSGQTLWQITGTPAVTGTYNVGLTAKDQASSGASRTVTATLVINITAGASRPTITTQPASQSVPQGQSATFTVVATGATPLSYQWRFKSAALSGQTGSTLVINPVTTNNAGGYDVMVSNSSGSVTSSLATLTIVVRPGITAPPASQTVTQGQSATFSVTASGTAPLSYQWRFNNANLSGQTGSTLLINPVTTNNAGGYNVIVSNSSGSVTSAVATLTVIVPVLPPTITVPPMSQSVTQGLSATFSVTASGAAPLNYQWRFKGGTLSGQTASTLVINPATTNNAGGYDVIVGNSVGSVTSVVATLTVIVPGSPLQILAQPVSQTVTQGQRATFSVTASGTAPLSYQWRFNNGNLAGQTSSNLVINSAATNNAGNYLAIVSNGSGSVTSAVASLAVLVPPAIISGPGSVTVTEGGTATFTVLASGTAPLRYYWRKGTTVVAGPIGSSFALANAQLTDAGAYSVIVSNAAGVALSASATLTVSAAPTPPSITVEPDDQSVPKGSSATFSVTVDGSAPLSFQWFFNATLLAGQTGQTLNVTNVDAADEGPYYVVVTNFVGSVTSRVASLTLATIKGTYNGLYYEPAVVSVRSSGGFTATVTDKGRYSGALLILGRRYRFSGQFDAAGRATNSIARGRFTKLSLQLELDTSGGDEIRGWVTDGTWLAQLSADRAVWNGSTRPAPQAGIYTLVILGTPDTTAIPAGNGFGSVKVDAAGRVRFQGVFADGKPVTAGATISKSGEWPLYSPLRGGEGALLGWLVFTNGAGDDLSGVLSCAKLQQPLDKYYPSGFAFETTATGSKYGIPAPGARVLDFTVGRLALTGGNLASGLTNSVVVGPDNRVVGPNGSRPILSIRLASGLFTGTVVNPATGRAVAFSGAILQKQNIGLGYFLGVNQSGSLFFGP